MLYQSPFYLLPTIEYDTVTDAVSDSFVFVPYAQGLLLPETPAEGLELTTLLSTSTEAYAKVDLTNSTDYTKQKADTVGPFVLGVKAIKTEADTSSSALIYSSEGLFTVSADEIVSGANIKLFTSSLEALVETLPAGVSIPVKSYGMNYLTMSQSSLVFTGSMITLVIPLTLLISGFLVWFKRQKR